MFTTRNSLTNYYLLLVSVFVVADVLSGGIIRDAVLANKLEYTLGLFIMIAKVGSYASDGPPGFRFVRSYSRHKL